MFKVATYIDTEMCRSLTGRDPACPCLTPPADWNVNLSRLPGSSKSERTARHDEWRAAKREREALRWGEGRNSNKTSPPGWNEAQEKGSFSFPCLLLHISKSLIVFNFILPYVFLSARHFCVVASWLQASLTGSTAGDWNCLEHQWHPSTEHQ